MTLFINWWPFYKLLKFVIGSHAYTQLVYLVGPVLPADHCFPSLHFSLGVHLDHLVLESRRLHQLSLVVTPEQCIYWVWRLSCH